MSRYSWVIAVVIFASLYLAFASHLPSHQEKKQPTATELKYSRAHSLGNGYTFDPRDGWQIVNVSNLSYKYGPHSPNSRRTTKAYSSHGALPNKVKAATPHPLHDAIPKKVTGIMKTVLNSLKGLGKSETVTTTWYTGNDLLNPSCWKNPVWAPTDNSFACALTLNGWLTKPKCFQFLELCNGPTKCVFVRVIDSCAGCAEGTRHVDVTKAPFSQLADLAAGILQVQMRHATNPRDWLDDLWGPKD